VSEVRLGWTAPTTNADGSPLTGLAGFKLYWGRASGVYNAIGSPKDMGNVTSGGVDIDETATWFFAVTAYKTSALESDRSTEVSRGIALGVVTGRAN